MDRTYRNCLIKGGGSRLRTFDDREVKQYQKQSMSISNGGAPHFRDGEHGLIAHLDQSVVIGGEKRLRYLTNVFSKMYEFV